jgi:hypothetical protein
MMKIIVGVLRDSEGEIETYEAKGYHIEYLDDHARKFGAMLIKKEEMSQDEVLRVRKSGYTVSSQFWINLALMSAKDHDKVVIADLQEEDNKKVFSKVI